MENEKDYNFGENIRRLRLAKGLTQTQLGEAAGLSKRMIVHYEKHAKKPPADKIATIAQALDVKVDELFDYSMPLTTKNKEDILFSRKLEKAKTLPKSDREFLSTMISELLKKNSKQ